MAAGRRLAGVAAALLGLAPPLQGQFGYEPPAPICPPFACTKGEKAVGKPGASLWSYGCKESGMNFLNAGSFDVNNPLGGASQYNVNKCCVDRDICKQTCGMTSKTCHEKYQACTAKICKGDQNCKLQASMADIMSEPYDESPLPKDDGKEVDWAKRETDRKCRGYNRGQAEACQCVPAGEYQAAAEAKLKGFYKRYNPEKLGKDGEIKNVAEVWSKWKGKEPDMFLALATKYKEQTVQIREKPKRDYSKDWTAPAADQKAEPAEAPAPPAEAVLSEEDQAFDRQRSDLEAKKFKAAKAEEYDDATAAKEELQSLVRAEVARLNGAKAQAIEAEDYAEAKRLKQRLGRLEL